VVQLSSLTLWDNGRGMNAEGVIGWATMGLSSIPEETKKLRFEKYVTSDFSRYGVGSKKAIFNIGDNVTITTKPKDSKWVYEVSLSRVCDSLLRYCYLLTLR